CYCLRDGTINHCRKWDGRERDKQGVHRRNAAVDPIYCLRMVSQVKDRLLDLYTVALAAGLGYLAYRAILSHSAPRAPRGVGSLGPIEPGDILPDAPAGTVPVASDPVTTDPAPGNNVLTSPMIGEATEQLCDLSPLYSFGPKCVGQTWTAGSATSLNVLAAMGTPVDW